MGFSVLVGAFAHTITDWLLPYQYGFTRKPRRFQGDPAERILKQTFLLFMATNFCFLRAIHHAPSLKKNLNQYSQARGF